MYGESGDDCYLTLLTDLFSDSQSDVCFRLYPTWSQVFATTNSVMSLLEKYDNEFYSHIERISRETVEMHVKNFVLDNMRKVTSSAI